MEYSCNESNKCIITSNELDTSFYQNSSVEYIYITGEVTKIPNYCFGFCTNLIEVHSCSKISYIGEYAFVRCLNLKNISFLSNVEVISDFALCNTNIESIHLNNNYVKIGNHAFYSSHMKEITLPQNITTILNGTFLGTGLKTIKIPSKVEKIMGYAFGYCAIESIELPESLIFIGQYAFINCVLLKNITLPKSLKIVECNAFYGSGIRKLEYPETIEKIDFTDAELNYLSFPVSAVNFHHEPFDPQTYKKSIVNVTYRPNDKIIPKYLYYNCIDLIEIDENKLIFRNGQFCLLPENIKVIEEYAFYGTDITKIKFSKSVKIIKRNAFKTMDGFSPVIFSNITFQSNNISIYQFLNAQIINFPDKDGNMKTINLTSNDEAEYKGEDLTELTMFQFYGYRNESLSLPESITTIPSFCFYHASFYHINLSHIVHVGDCAFYETNSNNFTFSDKLISIGNYAFEKVNYLILNLPESKVITYGEGAFYIIFGFNLQPIVNTMEFIPKYCFASSNYYMMGDTYPNDLEIPYTIKLIGYGAFEGSYFSSLKINNGDYTIQSYAFYYTQVARLDFNYGLQKIEDNALNYGIDIPNNNLNEYERYRIGLEPNYNFDFRKQDPLYQMGQNIYYCNDQNCTIFDDGALSMYSIGPSDLIFGDNIFVMDLQGDANPEAGNWVSTKNFYYSGIYDNDDNISASMKFFIYRFSENVYVPSTYKNDTLAGKPIKYYDTKYNYIT